MGLAPGLLRRWINFQGRKWVDDDRSCRTFYCLVRLMCYMLIATYDQPFYHVIAGIIVSSIGPDSTEKSIVATTILAFALSSLLTGLTFFALGALKLGSLSEFFPRHILVGCIGGVGAFLFITGLEISARIDESTGINSGIIRHLFDNEILPLWVRSSSFLFILSFADILTRQSLPLGLAILLRIVTMRYNHPLIFPGFFLAFPVVFWVIALSAGIPVEKLRAAGWVFEVKGVDSEWYEYFGMFGEFAFSLLHDSTSVPRLEGRA